MLYDDRIDVSELILIKQLHQNQKSVKTKCLSVNQMSVMGFMIH